MKKIIAGFVFAFRGLTYSFATQVNFKIHSVAAALVIILGCYVKLEVNEWMWICAVIGLVLITELFNTAIEVLVDLISPGYHEKAGIIKDISAAAVLITAILAAVTGLIIFIPKLG